MLNFVLWNAQNPKVYLENNGIIFIVKSSWVYLIFLRMKSENKKLIIWIFAIIVIIVIVCVFISQIKKSGSDAEIQAEIQALSETPAAEYCKNSWWTLEIKTDEADAYGMCNFEDGSACEIVEYFRWECLSASEQGESLYCSDWSVCEEDVKGLTNWIDDINEIEIEDDAYIEAAELDDADAMDDVDIDALYDYYQKEFSNSGDESWIEPL